MTQNSAEGTDSPWRTPQARAIGLMLGAGALVAATSLIAKMLGGGSGDAALSPFQISAGRFTFALCAILVVLAAMPSTRPSFEGANWRLHVMRSVCGWLGITCMFAAVARMPMAEATAISFLSPLVAMGLSVLMLGERIGPRKVLAAVLAVAGALLILRPGSEAFQLAGLFALAAAGLMGLETILIKRLSDTEPALRVLLINNLIGATVSGIAASLVWTAPLAWQWGLLVLVGVVMVSAQALFIQAMKRGEASFVVPGFYSVLVFATLYDLAIYGVVPGLAAVAGAALILSGGLVLAAQGNRRR